MVFVPWSQKSGEKDVTLTRAMMGPASWGSLERAVPSDLVSELRRWLGIFPHKIRAKSRSFGTLVVGCK